jgi:hypothetical protein
MALWLNCAFGVFVFVWFSLLYSVFKASHEDSHAADAVTSEKQVRQDARRSDAMATERPQMTVPV